MASRVCERWEPPPGGAFDRRLLDWTSLRIQGRPLNLEDPQTTIDKFSWLKLYHLNPLLPICSDKARVRDYVRFKGLGNLLVPETRIYHRPSHIDWNALPNAFVAKPNHGSHMVIFCRDKSDFDFGSASRRLGRWLRRNYSLRHAETNYRGIPRRIVIEPLLGLQTGLIEHKIHCFEGTPNHVVTILSRANGQMVRSKTDLDWNPVPRTGDASNVVEVTTSKPPHLEEMKRAAHILSEDFLLVRVDFLEADGRLYFNEITFFSRAGVKPRKSEEDERRVADSFDLTKNDLYMERGHRVHREFLEFMAGRRPDSNRGAGLQTPQKVSSGGEANPIGLQP